MLKNYWILFVTSYYVSCFLLYVENSHSFMLVISCLVCGAKKGLGTADGEQCGMRRSASSWFSAHAEEKLLHTLMASALGLLRVGPIGLLTLLEFWSTLKLATLRSVTSCPI